MSLLARIGYVIIGALFVIMGFTALVNPAETLVGFAWMWAIMLIAGGIIAIIIFVKSKDLPGRGFLLFAAIVQIIMGLILVGNGVAFTTVVALNVMQIWLIFAGIDGIVGCFELKRAGVKMWWLTLIIGIICLLIGLSSFSSAVFNSSMLALAVGAGLIFSGAGFVVRGFSNPEQ